MTTHALKVWPSEWAAIERGDKRFEYRKHDRDFAVGDILELGRWDPRGGYREAGAYTADKNDFTPSGWSDYPKHVLRFRVTYVLFGAFGVPDGYCVMSIAPL